MSETSALVVRRYLQDAIAAEGSFASQLQAFSGEARGEAANLLRECALETKGQHDRLAARLEVLGGTPSVSKGFLSHLFSLNPKPVHMHATDGEQAAQDLMTAFAVTNSHLAVYESLAVMAEAASDADTAALARSIQSADRVMAQNLWQALSTMPVNI